jgi:ribose transport system substrate-binding protein
MSLDIGRGRGYAMAVGLALILAACGGSATPSATSSATEPATEPATVAPAETTAATAEPSAAAETLDIAYIQTGSFDYYQRGVDGAQLAAPGLGAALTVLNSDLKPEKELANVEDAISKGVDGIVLFSVGRASEEAALAKAKEAGIPVAILYGYAPELEADGTVFMQADINATGRMAGDWLAKNVESGKVAVIQGALGRGDAEAYTTSFKAGIAANPGLELVGEPSAEWARDKAVAAMQNLLTANPDLAAVFVQNEDMALGAIQAIKAAGADVVVVTQNGSPDGLAAIDAGEIAATVGWSPAQEAQMALARLVEAIRTGTPPSPKLCATPLVLVTKANLDAASPWVPTEASTKASLTASCGG